MFEKHKMRKEAKEVLIQMQAQQYAKEKFDKQQQASAESEKGETVNEFQREANYEELSRIMSLRNDIRENIFWIMFGTILLIVEYLLIGPTFLLFSVITFGLVVYIFTGKFYHVHTQKLFLIKLESDRQAFMEFLSIPFKIFRHIDTMRLENSVMTQEGPVYMIDDIEFEGNIPVSMTFAYSHFPAYKFLLKKETYGLMVEYINKLVLVDFKLRSLLDLNTHAVASEMLREKMLRINQGKAEEAAELQKERQQLMKDIAEMFHDLEVTEKKSQVPEEDVVD